MSKACLDGCELTLLQECGLGWAQLGFSGQSLSPTLPRLTGAPPGLSKPGERGLLAVNTNNDSHL